MMNSHPKLLAHPTSNTNTKYDSPIWVYAHATPDPYQRGATYAEATMAGRFAVQHARLLSTQPPDRQVPLERVIQEQCRVERQIAEEQQVDRRLPSRPPPPATTSPPTPNRQLSRQFSHAKHPTTGPKGHTSQPFRGHPYLDETTRKRQATLTRQVRELVKTVEEGQLSDVPDDLNDTLVEMVSLVVYTSVRRENQTAMVAKYLTPERMEHCEQGLAYYRDRWMHTWVTVQKNDTHSMGIRDTPLRREITNMMRDVVIDAEIRSWGRRTHRNRGRHV